MPRPRTAADAAILDATFRVISRLGPARLTLAHVGAEIGLSPATLGVRVVKNNVGNTPARQMNANHCRTPGSSHPATFFFKS